VHLQVGGWIEQAKALAKQQPGTDCVAKGFPEIKDCEHFYEWNARVQITTCAHSTVVRVFRVAESVAERVAESC